MYKVLLVEDENKIREHLIGIIDWYKFNCLLLKPCHNGLDGLKSIKLNQPDIVISDIEMPYLNGLEMFEQASHYEYKKIILTSYSNFDYAKKGIALKVDEYLLKPIDVLELEEVINKCINE
ncbi:MAG: response regulator, partial [Bacilli bacterium]